MNYFSALFVLASLFLFSCEEEPLPIVTDEPLPPLLDTTYVTPAPSAAQDKIVLFEEFTGVRCPTCPNGHIAIENMKSNYPGRIIAIGIHDSSEFPLAKPFSGEENFHTDWGTTIFTVITKPNGIPYGIADRLIGSNTTSQWEVNAVQQMGVPTPANAELRILSYNPVLRELRFEVKFEITSDVNLPLFFSTAITEDSLIGRQEYTSAPGGIVEDYVHFHVLRDMPHFKVNLNPQNVPEATKGRVFLRQYAYTLPEKWNPKNCRLIAFIHKDVDVLQAVETHIQ
ncbi:MAG: Omp28-related outer membrane protein [Bacteroidia bacterium]